MTNHEISKELYEQMCLLYEDYIFIEHEYKAEDDYYKKNPILERLTRAREQWLSAVERFRTHLAYLKESNGG